jgi:hypothetical protein
MLNLNLFADFIDYEQTRSNKAFINQTHEKIPKTEKCQLKKIENTLKFFFEKLRK